MGSMNNNSSTCQRVITNLVGQLARAVSRGRLLLQYKIIFGGFTYWSLQFYMNYYTTDTLRITL
jgi:hypothetical protein